MVASVGRSLEVAGTYVWGYNRALFLPLLSSFFYSRTSQSKSELLRELGLHTSELSRVIYSTVSRDDQDDGGYINTSLSFPYK